MIFFKFIGSRGFYATSFVIALVFFLNQGIYGSSIWEDILRFGIIFIVSVVVLALVCIVLVRIACRFDRCPKCEHRGDIEPAEWAETSTTHTKEEREKHKGYLYCKWCKSFFLD
jgi:hypothetical protein